MTAVLFLLTMAGLAACLAIVGFAVAMTAAALDLWWRR